MIDADQSTELLAKLHTRSDQNRYDASILFQLALAYQTIGNIDRPGIIANRVIKRLSQGLDCILKGEQVKKFGMDFFRDRDTAELTDLIEPGKRKEAEQVFTSISNITTLMGYRYRGVKWEDVRSVFSEFGNVADIAIASNKLLKVANEDKGRREKHITGPSIRFLQSCVHTSPGIYAADVDDALAFYTKGGSTFMPTTTKDAIVNLVEYFLHVKRYIFEQDFAFHHHTDPSVRAIAKGQDRHHLAYVIGNHGRGLVAALESTDDTDEIQRIKEQMVSQILETHKLKTRLGPVGYDKIVLDILKPKFFDQLRVDEEISKAQHTAIRNFLERNSPLRIPIHEYRTQVVSLNETYTLDVRLGNAGSLQVFVKLVPNKRRGFFEREKFLIKGQRKTLIDAGINVPAYYDFTKVGDLHVSLFGFIRGHNLYQLLQKSSLFPAKTKKAVLEQAVAQLYAIQETVTNIDTKEKEQTSKGLSLEELTEGSTYFTDQLKPHFQKNKRITSAKYGKVLAAFSALNDYLVKESVKDGVYYKDANPRNVMVQLLLGKKGGKPLVVHVDYEYGAKILGEVDLAKLLRNGLDIHEFNTKKNYSYGDETGQQSAIEYLKDPSLSYLTPSEEEKFLQGYNDLRKKQEEEQSTLRYPMASIFAHMWYVAWFSHKAEGKHISDETRIITKNRFNYHLLSAKVALDKTIKSDEQIATSMNLINLRKSLDGIAMYNA